MAAYSIYKGYEMGIFNRQTVHQADLIMMALETEKLKLRNGCLHLEGTCAGAGLGPADRPERDGSVSYYLGEAVVSDEQRERLPLCWLTASGRSAEEVYRIRR